MAKYETLCKQELQKFSSQKFIFVRMTEKQKHMIICISSSFFVIWSVKQS